ncbi:YqaA family protein [Candidatus Neomarinimicrobiota bacterium]
MRWIRNIYDWVLKWAESPAGPAVLVIVAFSESSFFIVPPDILLIALAIGARKKSLLFAAYCSIASVAGGIFGYIIGHYIWWQDTNQFSGIAMFFFEHIPGFTDVLFYKVQELYDSWNFWIIFTAGFTPIPYKIFTISAGAFDINFVMFLFASIISRSARFFLVAGLIWLYGEPIKSFIDKYFNILAILVTVLLIGGFLIIKYLI